MATLERIDPTYAPWTPTGAGLTTDEEGYVGRHRKPSGRRWSLTAFSYVAKHRAV